MPYSILIVILLCIILPAANRRRQQIIFNKIRRRENRMLPTGLMEEFIGKVCTIVTYNELSGTTGKIVGVEANWLKVQTKKETKLINGDMIRDITIMADKYQW